MNLLAALAPHHMQLRLFLLQLPHLPQHLHRIRALRQHQPIGQDRRQNRGKILFFKSQTLTRKGSAQARHGTDASRRHLIRSPEAGPAVHTQNIRLFHPGLLPRRGAVLIAYRHLDPEHASRHLQMSQPVSGRISGNLIDPRAEFLWIFPLPRITPNAFQQRLHSFQAQSRSEVTGKNLPGRHRLRHGCIGQPSRLQILLQKRLAAKRQFLKKSFLLVSVKGNTSFVQLTLQLGEQRRAVVVRLIHLIHKHKDRDTILLQKLPERCGMPLHPVGAADHKQRVIQHLKRPFHLRRKVHMPRGIQKRQLQLPPGKPCLLGKNRDPTLSFQGKIIQKGIPVIYPPKLSHCPRSVQQRLGQGSFAGVHMGQHANTYLFFYFFRLLFSHQNVSFENFLDSI